MSINRQHKDGVFTAYFGNLDRLRQLYSAATGEPVSPSAVITVNTLSDVLFMYWKNDISFMIDRLIILFVEHQSTLNRNIPLRMFLYGGRVYEKLLELRGLYRQKQIRLPRPLFFVFYNGSELMPDRWEERLSDAFEGSGSAGLELTVVFLNINAGHNEELMARCPALREYSQFIAKVRAVQAELTPEKPRQISEEAVTRSVKYCIEHNIMRDFLRENASEVVNMLFTEYNLADALEVAREEGREDAFEAARKIALADAQAEIRRAQAQWQAAEAQRQADKLQFARKLMQKGWDYAEIIETTGLDAEAVTALFGEAGFPL
ncbi:MAG: hypothetical protein LBG73_08320 [Spirochaetaceae bacterium]|jgi:hypothetical protein|nr:hypothetical protein [Spirochaetaceae bacterium]